MRNHSSTYSRTRKHVNESLYGLFSDLTYHSRDDIREITMVPTDAHVCRVKCDGRSVYANYNFTTGDIIEICPTREVSKDALYSKDIREMVFEVKPNEEYVIPMGYCQFYEITDAFHRESNCDYEWNEKKRSIIIRATDYIDKGTLLVINIKK
jgi:hypothetical protein